MYADGYRMMVARRQVSLPPGWKASTSWRDGDLSFSRPVRFGHLYVDRIGEGLYRAGYEGIEGTRRYGDILPLFQACAMAERCYCSAAVSASTPAPPRVSQMTKEKT